MGLEESVLARVPVISAKVAWQSAGGEAVVVDLELRKVMGLNPSGSFLWSRVDGKKSLRALAQELMEKFGIAQDVAQQDAVAFVDAMKAKGLLEFAGT